MTSPTPSAPLPPQVPAASVAPAAGPVAARPGVPVYALAEDPALQRLRSWLPTARIVESPQGPECITAETPTPPDPQALTRRGALIPLPDLGLLRVAGPDAASFLQGQLTNDVLTLGSDAWRWTGYCTPKGRLISTALNWRSDEGLFLAVARTQAAGLARRLGMYVLRAKARVVDRSPTALAFGLLGPAVTTVAGVLGFGADIAASDGSASASGGAVAVHGPATLIRLDPLPADAGLGPAPLARALLWINLDGAPGAEAGPDAAAPGNAADAAAGELHATGLARLQALLAEQMPVAGSAAPEPGASALVAPLLADTGLWRWTEVRSGIARLFPGSAELFVPQMLNFEAVGGVNFKKGCYPGQEIVARSQYLGKLKRRMFLGHLDGPSAPLPTPGQDVNPQAGGEPSGQVVLSAAAPGGGIDVLYESQIAAATAGVTIDGREVIPLALPYTLG